MNLNKKNLGMLAIALLAFVVAEGTGLTAPPKAFISHVTDKVKSFFQNLFPMKG
jgi:hypothetical protein